MPAGPDPDRRLERNLVRVIAVLAQVGALLQLGAIYIPLMVISS